MKAHAPSRNTALICLIAFILGLIGWFVPLGQIRPPWMAEGGKTQEEFYATSKGRISNSSITSPFIC